MGLARRERPPKSSSSHPSTSVGARAVSTYGRPRLPQGLPRLHRRGSRRRWGPAREGPGPTLVHQVLYHRLLGSSYGHGRRVEAAGCRLPGLSHCRTTSRILIEEAAILEADLPACSATSCACSCPRCGAAPSYARSASLICTEAVTRSPTLTSAPSCAITRLCRRACFLRSWKKTESRLESGVKELSY